ncbi:MAG: hypothetical protein RL033_5468 [Pseudomonadota bacterium]|jgi:hypothetical protein
MAPRARRAIETRRTHECSVEPTGIEPVTS